MAKRSAAATGAIIGLAIGAVVGFMIGGIGIAAMGGAGGVPAFVLLGMIGAAVGYHFGRVRDLKAR